MITVTLIRHPKSTANELHVIAKSSHVDISDYGEKTGQLFVDHHHDEIIQKNPLIVTGTQMRSKRLVEVLQGCHPSLQIIESESFNERDFGIFGDRTKQEVIEILQKMHPEHKEDNEFSSWMDRNIDLPSWMDRNIDLPGGFESNHQIQSRIKTGLYKVISDYPKVDAIWFITSTGFIRNALAIALGKTALEIDQILPHNKIPNLSKTTLHYHLDTPQLRPGGKLAYTDPILQQQFENYNNIITTTI